MTFPSSDMIESHPPVAAPEKGEAALRLSAADLSDLEGLLILAAPSEQYPCWGMGGGSAAEARAQDNWERKYQRTLEGKAVVVSRIVGLTTDLMRDYTALRSERDAARAEAAGLREALDGIAALADATWESRQSLRDEVVRRINAATATPPAAGEGADAVTIRYRNYKGEVRDRRVGPLFWWYGVNEWHKEPGWLLHAVDLDKGAERDFALGGMLHTLSGRLPPLPREAYTSPESLLSLLRGEDAPPPPPGGAGAAEEGWPPHKTHEAHLCNGETVRPWPCVLCSLCHACPESDNYTIPDLVRMLNDLRSRPAPRPEGALRDSIMALKVPPKYADDGHFRHGFENAKVRAAELVAKSAAPAGGAGGKGE